MRKEWDEKLYNALDRGVGYDDEWAVFRRPKPGAYNYAGQYGEYRIYRLKTPLGTPHWREVDWYVTRWNGRRWHNVSKRFGTLIRMKSWPDFIPEDQA